MLVRLAATSAKTMTGDSIIQAATLLDDERRAARIRAARSRAEIEAALKDP